jgi:hypothetical protein
LFTPPAAVFVEVVKGRTLRKFELAADATALSDIKYSDRVNEHRGGQCPDRRLNIL